MITLDADNRYVYIRGAHRTTIRKLEKVTSYYVSGFMFAPAFKRRVWDGREHLLKFKKGDSGGYRAPFGLLGDIIRCLKEEGEDYTLMQKRRTPAPKHVEYQWNPSITLRDYQERVVKIITKPKRWDTGHGLIKMPIRSGKTKTAARIIHDLKTTALFIVPSQMLLHQTVKALEEALGCYVGTIGDGEWKEGDVTVATVQTLTMARGYKPKRGEKKIKRPRDPRYTALLKRYGLIILDEAHHGKAPTWREAVMDFDCPYKIGLSATIYLDLKSETEKGIIWAKAICGDIRVDISTSELIEAGHLMRPTIQLHSVLKPENIGDEGWSNTLRNKAILENKHRNRLIVKLALEQLERGQKVLIVTNRLNQLERLASAFERAGTAFCTIAGPDKKDAREERVQSYLDGHVNLLIGTVFGEGVDIPIIECVINAEGGADIKSTLQRMRNLTISEGKTEALFIDFIDYTNPYFTAHSLERFRVYREERAFQIQLAS